MGPSHTTIGKIMNRKLTASPESFDRCQTWRYQYIPKHWQWFDEAVSSLNHPTNPTANVLLSLLRAIDKINRIDTQVHKKLVYGVRDTWPAFIRVLGFRASDILRHEGRPVTLSG
ncbi:hypothetical protein F4776DRAFT_416446 [Hypoxylon sp. NC0597]|nr:hypothetical protein F4776DRAFT_416446 [Hypoxylon sp. NC0597]